MKTMIKTVNYLVILLAAIIIASCGEKPTPPAPTPPAPAPPVVVAIPNCIDKSPFQIGNTLFRADFDYPNNTFVVYDRRTAPEKVYCTCDMNTETQLIFQVSTLLGVKNLALGRYAGAAPTAGYTKKTITKPNTNEMFVDILSNTVWKPGTTPANTFRIIGTEDDRNGATAASNLTYVIANLENGNPVYLKYIAPVGGAGGNPKKYEISAANSSIIVGMPSPAVIKESVNKGNTETDNQLVP